MVNEEGARNAIWRVLLLRKVKGKPHGFFLTTPR